MSECAISVEGQAQIALRQRLFSKRSFSLPMSSVDHSQEKEKIYFLTARQSVPSYRLSGFRRKSHFKRRLLQTEKKGQFQKSFKGFCQFASTLLILFDSLREANKDQPPDVGTSYTLLRHKITRWSQTSAGLPRAAKLAYSALCISISFHPLSDKGHSVKHTGQQSWITEKVYIHESWIKVVHCHIQCGGISSPQQKLTERRQKLAIGINSQLGENLVAEKGLSVWWQSVKQVSLLSPII